MQNTEPASDRLMLAIERMVRATRMQMAHETVSSRAAATLNALAADGPQGITQLAHAQGVSQPAMTQLIDRLATEGLVTRQVTATDRRAVQVELTPAGAAMVAERRIRRTAQFERDLDTLAADDRTTITAAVPALERLAEAMSTAALPLPERARTRRSTTNTKGANK